MSSAFTSNGSEPAHASHQGQQQATAEERSSAHNNKEQSDRQEVQVAEPVPGVVAIVYEDFFSKASEVALKLLKVPPRSGMPPTFSSRLCLRRLISHMFKHQNDLMKLG